MPATLDLIARPASLLFSYDGDTISVRAAGQQRYCLDRHEIVDAPDLTAGQAKRRAADEWGDAEFCDLRVRRVHMRYDPDFEDEESARPGAWVPCQAGSPDAHLYWQVTRPAG